MQKSPPIPENAGSRRELMALAWPLIVANSFFTLQIAIDRAMLSQHSTDQVGAAMAAVLLFWTPFALLQFTANYASVFVAQYAGAQRPERVGPAVAQSLLFSLVAGTVFAAIVYPLADTIVSWGGHSEVLQKHEADYLGCMAFAALPMLLTASASSFFTGRGNTGAVLVVNGVGCAVNALLCYVWIFGHFGFAEMGIAGAGWATVVSSWVAAFVALGLMLRRRHRLEFGTHRLLSFERELFVRMMRYGIPNGIMVALDGLAFTLFTFLVGTLGPAELAATSIAFTLNAVAFLPAMGVAQAVEILVGNRLGADRPDLAEKSVWSGMRLMIGWMIPVAALYVGAPELFLPAFASDRSDWAEVQWHVTVLMRFIAVYSLFDAMNLTLSFALRGAGDTRFVAWTAFALAWPLMLFPTWLVLRTQDEGRLYFAWSFVTLYIAGLAVVYLLRFRGGLWKSMRVIESAVDPTIVGPALTEAIAPDASASGPA